MRSFRLLLPVILVAALEFYPVLFGEIPLPVYKSNQFGIYASVFGDKYSDQRGADNGDLVTQIYPWRAYAAEQIRNGTVPLWNPRILAGTPFLANAQSALFYPPNLLFYVFPADRAWSFVVVLQVLFAGSFAALYVSSAGLNPWGSAFVGLVFSVCGFMTAWRGFPLEDSALWLPAMLWCVDRLAVRFSGLRLAVGAVVVAMPLLAGHPETAAHIYLIVGAYALMRSRSGARLRFLATAALAFVIGLALAAIQILPTLDWLNYIPRSIAQSLPPRPAFEISALFSRDLLHSPNAAQIHIPEGASYVGMITLLLAFWAPLHRDRRLVVFWAVSVGISLAIVYGAEPLYSLFGMVPVIGGLKHSRLLLLADFGLAMLAGLGLAAAADDRNLVRKLSLGLLVLSCVICGGGTFLMLHNSVDDAGSFRTATATFGFLLAGGLILFARTQRRIQSSVFSAACLVLVGIDLFTAGHRFLRFATKEEIFPPAPVVRFLQENTHSGERVAGLNLPYGYNTEMPYRLSTPGGYDIPLVRSRRFVFDYIRDNQDGFNLLPERVASLRDRRLDLLSVRYVVVTGEDVKTIANQPERFAAVFQDGPVQVFENRAVMSRSFFIPAEGVELIPEELDQLDRVSDAGFDPEKRVILDESPSFSARTSSAGESRVYDFAQTANEIRVKAEVNSPGILVVSEMNFPGWQATVDGKPSRILLANYALLGVALEPGLHQVRFAYAPRSFRIGAGITVFTSVLILVLGIGSVRGGFVQSRSGLGKSEPW